MNPRADALDRRFGIALGVSLVVHATVMMLSLPTRKVPALEEPIPLHVRLLQPQPVALVREPAPVAEVPKPAPLKRSAPKRETKAPAAPKPAPSAPPLVAAEPSIETARETPAEPPVVLAPPPPIEQAPPPVAISLPAPAPVEAVATAQLLAGYGKKISDVLARYKEYPHIAQMRGWEGSVTMRLRVAPSGRLVDAELYASSGYEVLDRQAIAMATRVAQLPVPPQGLTGGEVAVLVPVVFRLER